MEQEVHLLVRLASELAIKSKRTRTAFQQRLIRNMKDAMRTADAPARVDSAWGRIYARTNARGVAALPRVFGISSISPVERVVPAELDAIVAAGVELFSERVRGRSFAVRARRAGTHSFSSTDVMVRLGAALRPLAERVDLSNPEVEVHVEVRNKKAYFFADRLVGTGGLPIGVEGHAIALLSGGYDSAVAAWLMLKRGIDLDYVFCNLGGDAYERAVVAVGKVLADEWSYGTRPRLHVVDFGPALDDLRAKVRESYWQVVLKRMMYRAACAVAAERRAEAIITGEAVGQVSSQTLTNLRAIESASDLPIFRPLIGFDKEEIIERARRIGTAALSEQVKEYCAITPGKPVTAARVEAVAAEDARLDHSLVEAAVRERRVLDLRSLTATDLVAPYLFSAEIPKDAVVLDCRPEPQYRAWHFPGARHVDEYEMLRSYKHLDRDRTYLLYCAHGVQTAHLAERMQRAGYEAYSFRGGLGGVMRYASEHGIEGERG